MNIDEAIEILKLDENFKNDAPNSDISVNRQARKTLNVAYRALALKHHPDRNKGNEEQASQQFRIVKDAYDLLVLNYFTQKEAPQKPNNQPPKSSEKTETKFHNTKTQFNRSVVSPDARVTVYIPVYGWTKEYWSESYNPTPMSPTIFFESTEAMQSSKVNFSAIVNNFNDVMSKVEFLQVGIDKDEVFQIAHQHSYYKMFDQIWMLQVSVRLIDISPEAKKENQLNGIMRGSSLLDILAVSVGMKEESDLYSGTPYFYLKPNTKINPAFIESISRIMIVMSPSDDEKNYPTIKNHQRFSKEDAKLLVETYNKLTTGFSLSRLFNNQSKMLLEPLQQFIDGNEKFLPLDKMQAFYEQQKNGVLKTLLSFDSRFNVEQMCSLTELRAAMKNETLTNDQTLFLSIIYQGLTSSSQSLYQKLGIDLQQKSDIKVSDLKSYWAKHHKESNALIGAFHYLGMEKIFANNEFMLPSSGQPQTNVPLHNNKPESDDEIPKLTYR